MSAAVGIADFASTIPTDDATLYRTVEEAHHFVAVPSRLEVAQRDGEPGPDLSLELVRGESPFLPPAPYGVLDMRVTTPELGSGEVAAARALDPAAFVTPAVFEGGYLRLQVIGGRGSVEENLLHELERPVWLASNGLDSVRLVRRLTAEAALVVRDALEEGVLTMTAVAEMSLRGLADRLEATLQFEQQALLDALVAAADDEGRVAVGAITELWMREGAIPLVEASGLEALPRTRLARALTDWTTASYTVPTAASGPEVVATVRISNAIAAGPVRWDLSRGRTTSRTSVLRLDPFAAARELVAAGKLDRVFHQTVVPPIETGIVHIDVDTNLPRPMRGVARAGVQLRAAPHPPERVHELSAALLFDDAQEAQRIEWRLSPGEPLRYEFACFVLLLQGGKTKRLDAAVKPADSRRLLIGVDDLPVELVTIAAGDALLREAAVHGSCGPAGEVAASSASGGADPIAFELGPDQPLVAFAFEPGTSERFTLDLEACPLDGSGPCVTLGPLPARSLKLDVGAFPEFGPQTVDVSVDFDVDADVVAIDVIAERDVNDPARATVLSFTPAVPSREWSYLSPSPFRAGYFVRGHEAGGAWSGPHPAGSALRLRASELVAPPGPATEAPRPAESGFRFEDLLCYPGDDPAAHFVIPLVPRPEVDGNGRPVLMVLPMGEDGLLQLGVHLGPDGASVERLRVELARRLGLDPNLVQIQVAPIEVVAATLLVTAEDGTTQEIGRRSTSNFPPFTATFSERLDAGQRAAVSSAVAGHSDRLRVRYEARVSRPATATAVVAGDIRTIVTRFAGGAGDPEAVAADAVRKAIEDGTLTVDLTADTEGAGELLDHTRAQAVNELVALVSRLAIADPTALAEAPTEIRVTRSEPSWQSMTPTVDISSWFSTPAPLQPTAT